MSRSVSITALATIPDIYPGDDLGEILCSCIDQETIVLHDGDVVCIAHKVISKAEGRIVDLTKITPSKDALYYAKKLNKDPRKVEVILQESKRVVRHFRHENQNEGTMICEHRLGFISANAAVDESNVFGAENVIILPRNPDVSAKKLKMVLEKKFNKQIGILITDTFGRPWRVGQVNVAVGISGIPSTLPEKGNYDAYGRKLTVTESAFCDEIAAASGLVIKKAAKTPVVVFKGLNWTSENSKAKDILRLTKEDMFL
ncbi:MAG: coenzyme F420-0:L-glutamate ligase [Paracoccaceae bacterium]|nr:coenzyme F420-0:L-glutamate ligase [Paracoccaceae bacterium]